MYSQSIRATIHLALYSFDFEESINRMVWLQKIIDVSSPKAWFLFSHPESDIKLLYIFSYSITRYYNIFSIVDW